MIRKTVVYTHFFIKNLKCILNEQSKREFIFILYIQPDAFIQDIEKYFVLHSSGGAQIWQC